MRRRGATKAALAAKHRIEKGLEALRQGLGPYVAKHMLNRHGNHWRHYASRARAAPMPANALDVYALLKTLLEQLERTCSGTTRGSAGPAVSFRYVSMRATVQRTSPARWRRARLCATLMPCASSWLPWVPTRRGKLSIHFMMSSARPIAQSPRARRSN